VDIKNLKRSASQYCSKIVFKVLLSNVKDGMQNDILWDDSEQSGGESATEGSLDELSE
jgi:hypothetical protein